MFFEKMFFNGVYIYSFLKNIKNIISKNIHTWENYVFHVFQVID